MWLQRGQAVSQVLDVSSSLGASLTKISAISLITQCLHSPRKELTISNETVRLI